MLRPDSFGMDAAASVAAATILTQRPARNHPSRRPESRLNGQHQAMSSPICPHLAVGEHRQDQTRAYFRVASSRLSSRSSVDKMTRWTVCLARGAAEASVSVRPSIGNRLPASSLPRRTSIWREFVRQPWAGCNQRGEHHAQNEDCHDDARRIVPCRGGSQRTLRISRRRRAPRLPIRSSAKSPSHSDTTVRLTLGGSTLSRQESRDERLSLKSLRNLPALVHLVSLILIEIHRQQIDGRSAVRQDTGGGRRQSFRSTPAGVCGQSDRLRVVLDVSVRVWLNKTVVLALAAVSLMPCPLPSRASVAVRAAGIDEETVLNGLGGARSRLAVISRVLRAEPGPTCPASGAGSFVSLWSPRAPSASILPPGCQGRVDRSRCRDVVRTSKSSMIG